jgi:transposase
MPKKNWKELISRTLEENGYCSVEAQNVFLLEMKALKYFKFEDVMPQCLELENIERDEKEIRYYWKSNSNEAECPNCHTVSRRERKDFKRKPIQDIASEGLAVYHHIESKRWYCDNHECETKIFVERYYEYIEEKQRKTNRFKERCKNMALACGSLGAEHELRAEGSVVCDDTIIRYVKAAAAEVTKSNLTRDDVKVLSVDDFNTRKGDSSSGCTVFIDQETHKVLIIVKGTTKEVVQSIIEKFPSSEFLSRDRACSLSAAGDACDKTQVADRFHLFLNIHKAIDDALMAEIPANIFLREGDGWVNITQESDKKDVYTVPDEDIEKRIQLAGLTESKSEKYRNTLKMLEMSDKGLRTADIAKELEITVEAVRVLRRSAASTIREVQDKIVSRIEKYPENSKGQGRPPVDGNRKTLGPNPGPAHKSIVEPYRDTVVEMWNSGKSHHQIHPALVEKGFSGSKAAVYQYICKLEYEDPCTLTRKMKQKKPGTPWVDGFDKQEAQNISELTLDKVTRNTVYKSILKEGKSEREKEELSENEMKSESVAHSPKDADINDKEISESKGSKTESEKGDLSGKEMKSESFAHSTNNTDTTEKEVPSKIKSNKPAMAKYSPLDPEILDLMYGKDEEQPEDTPKPNGNVNEGEIKKTAYEKIKDNYPIIYILLMFLTDFHAYMDKNDVMLLDGFISKYKNSEIAAIAQFANGLTKDYDAVKNCLLYPHISNGPIEGINSRTKYIHRRGSGRAGVELLNAYRVLAA